MERSALNLTGIPEDDWLKLFETASSVCLKNVYEDARYLRLLHKGALLSQRLSETWRQNGSYLHAAEAIEEALTQEHFSMASREWKGIFIMNIHKSKGKEFDEVIIWEEFRKPIVYESNLSQGRLLMRVAVTRARSFCTILTPASEPCILL